jgi:nitrite reductase/ring-hydroxylating ferredoxin subunit
MNGVDEVREWRVATLDDVAEPGALEFKTGEGDWPFRGFVVRWQGQVYAYANSCPHQGHPLNLIADRFFAPDGAQLVCASHGALFEPATGACVAGPCTGNSLVPLPCRTEGNAIFVTAPAAMT